MRAFSTVLLVLLCGCVAAPSGAEMPAGEALSVESLDLPASGKRVVASKGLAPGFAAEADAVMASIETWRGLPFLTDLVIEFVPESEAAEKLAGWYEPDTDRLVVVQSDNARFAKGTMLHEMVHALQDQHFDLSAVHLTATDADGDRALAGLIEGEAMLAVSEIMDYDFERHAVIPPKGELDEVRFAKVFHYGAGLRFVRALREAGGWDQVDRAYRHPPTGSAQIYHADRYLAGVAAEAPSVDLLDKPSRWQPDTERLTGEFALRIVLSRDVATRGRAVSIATGLAGDARFVRAGVEPSSEKGGDEPARVWLLSFREASGAAAFLQAAGELGLAAELVGKSETVVRVDD